MERRNTLKDKDRNRESLKDKEKDKSKEKIKDKEKEKEKDKDKDKDKEKEKDKDKDKDKDRDSDKRKDSDKINDKENKEKNVEKENRPSMGSPRIPRKFINNWRQACDRTRARTSELIKKWRTLPESGSDIERESDGETKSDDQEKGHGWSVHVWGK